MPFDGTGVSDTTALLIEAKAIIARHGWRQRSRGNTETGFCVAGAIIYASGQPYELFQPSHPTTVVNRTIHNAISVVERAIYKNDRQLGQHLAKWNDESGRTVDEVFAVFDEAISDSISS
jgi:hypothetical protein